MQNRRDFLQTSILGSVGLAAPAWLHSAAAGNSRPNFVIILADDLGFGDIGAYRALYEGHDDKPTAYRHTPNLDGLAYQGIRCTRAYSCSWCAPSRQALLSGQWANRRSAYDHPWIGNQLRQLGYTTGMVGKSHGRRPTNRAMRNKDPDTAEFNDGLFFPGGMRDYYLHAGETFPCRKAFTSSEFTAEGGEYITDVFTDHAVDIISRNASQPFMLYLAYTAPHTPLQGKPEDLRTLFPDAFRDLSDEEIIATSKPRPGQSDMINYHYSAMVYAMDRGIGRIMRALRDKGVDDNTVVIFTSDNGARYGSNYPLTGHKWDDLEGGIRVPFLVWSHRIATSPRSGAVYDGLVSLADIAPTVMARASDRPYAHATDGIDLTPYLMKQKPRAEGRCYFWSNTSKDIFLTGFHDFDPGMKQKEMEQAVFIHDREKIIRWSPPGLDEVGVVYTRLPDASGKDAPSEMLHERTPTAGAFPESKAGRKLFREMLDCVRSPRGKLLPDWSGGHAGRLSDYEWWGRKK